jgi:hypothetical protein
MTGALGAALLLTLVTRLAQAQPRVMNVWVAPSLQRVGVSDQPGNTADARIFAARGEAESFQIVLRGLQSVRISDIRLSNLTGPGGAVISRTNFTLYREHYVLVDEGSRNPGGSNAPLRPGSYADALIPFTDPVSGAELNGPLDAVPFALEPGRNQPFWIDLAVPRTATPGTYTGSYTVVSDGGNVTGAVTVEVWSFALPARPALKSSFPPWDNNTPAVQEELLRHRLSPRNTDPALQRPLIERGLTVGELGFWSGAAYNNCRSMTLPPPPSVAEIRRVLLRQQPELFVFNYTADEIDECPHLFTPLREWARALHQAGANNLVTMKPVPQLLDDGLGSGRSVVDVWALLPIMYEQAGPLVDRVLAKGDEVWSYNGLSQEGYSPKWLIDFAPINFRIQPGFIGQSLHLTGLLYWRVDFFRGDPWVRANNKGSFGEDNYPGEGSLMYPGARVGVNGLVPSLRLKWLRDGVDDYDYLELLKKSGHADSAIRMAREIGPDWHNWTRDANRLEAARVSLGQELDTIVRTSGAFAAPAVVSPALGATGVPHNSVLTWNPIPGATLYEVYFGASNSPPPVATTSSTAYFPGALQQGETYHWRVTARSPQATAVSETFWFTTAPAAPVPDGGVRAVLPAQGRGAARTFEVVVADLNGASGIAGVTFLMNQGPVYLNACWIYWDRASKSVSLSGDDTSRWTTTPLSAPGTLRNSQCVLDAANSSAVDNGNEVRLSLSLSFTSAFAGDRAILAGYKNSAGADSLPQAMAVWTVEASATVSQPNE